MSAVRRWFSGIIFTIASVVGVPQAVAQQTPPDTGPPSLEARVDELDQEIRVLQRLRELAADSAEQAARDRQSATANAKDGFSLKSADGKYVLKLRGYAQADARFVPGDAGAFTNSFLLRRARPIIEASVGRYFDFRIMPDFAQGQTVLFDAYWEGKFDPAFTVRAGKFKSPVSLERLRSATDLTFAERGFPSNLAPNRDIGLQLAGDISDGLLSYQAGIFDGAADLGNVDADLSDSKDLVARVFVQPFRRGALQGSGFGMAGSTGNEQGSAAATGLTGYRTPSQQTFFRYRTSTTTPAGTALADGRRARLYPQAFLALGSLGVLGEYALSRQDVVVAGTTARLEHHAWQASGSYFLTGEKAGFRTPSPRQPFDLKAGTFGALELAARYGEIDIDQDAFPIFADPASSASKAKGVGLGVNWYLNKAIKVLVNYEHTTFAGGAATGDRPAEDFVVTRFQHSF